MCDCVNVLPGTYGNQVEIKELPAHMLAYKRKQGGADSICIDRCVADEVQELWAKGITTTGCCCGHNIKDFSFIGVIDEDIARMKDMGYEVRFNPSRPSDEDSFIPKTI